MIKQMILALVCVTCIQNEVFAQELAAIREPVRLDELHDVNSNAYWLGVDCGDAAKALTAFRTESDGAMEVLSTDITYTDPATGNPVVVTGTAGVHKFTDPGGKQRYLNAVELVLIHCKNLVMELSQGKDTVYRGPIDPSQTRPEE